MICPLYETFNYKLYLAMHAAFNNYLFRSVSSLTQEGKKRPRN